MQQQQQIGIENDLVVVFGHLRPGVGQNFSKSDIFKIAIIWLRQRNPFAVQDFIFSISQHFVLWTFLERIVLKLC